MLQVLAWREGSQPELRSEITLGRASGLDQDACAKQVATF